MDDKVITQTNENDLERATYEVNKICKNYHVIISTVKPKTTAFRQKKTVRTKTAIGDKVIEQVPHFTYQFTNNR